MNLLEILEHAKQLTAAERRTLAKLLIDTLSIPDEGKTHSILEFEGMAAELNDGEDPQDYVRRIREEWDS